MLNASSSQNASSQTSVNIAVEQIVARHLNDDGSVQEVIHDFAHARVLASQIFHLHDEADIYDLVQSNSSIQAIIAENQTGITFFGTLKCFHGHVMLFPLGYLSSVDSSSNVKHVVPDVKRSGFVKSSINQGIDTQYE